MKPSFWSEPPPFAIYVCKQRRLQQDRADSFESLLLVNAISTKIQCNVSYCLILSVALLSAIGLNLLTIFLSFRKLPCILYKKNFWHIFCNLADQAKLSIEQIFISSFYLCIENNLPPIRGSKRIIQTAPQ